MSPAHVEEHSPFFFSQRRNRRFQRRLKKTLDDTSVFGEKREPSLALRADGESVVSARVLPPAAVTSEAPPSPKHRRAESGKRVALSEKVVVLPPVDWDGPRLVSGDPQQLEVVETKPPTNEKFIKSLLEEAKPRSGSEKSKIKELYRFNELKFGSTSILSNLTKVLYPGLFEDYVRLPEGTPVEFANKFLQDHQSLTADVVVEKREWQTDCYLDLGQKNEQPFLTGLPGEEEEKKKSEEVVATIARHQTRKKAQHDKVKPHNKPQQVQKRVTMSREVVSNWRSSKRPQTARSILSNLSFHSDYSQGSSAEDGDEYDILPPELRPSILLYRRETQAPKVKVKGPKTRLEKFKSQGKKDDKSHLKRGPKSEH